MEVFVVHNLKRPPRASQKAVLLKTRQEGRLSSLRDGFDTKTQKKENKKVVPLDKTLLQFTIMKGLFEVETSSR